MKKIFFLTFIVLFSAVVYADSNFVSPEVIHLEMKQGEKMQDTFYVKNLENYSMNYIIDLLDPVDDIIGIREDSAYLGPKQGKDITLNLNIPYDYEGSDISTDIRLIPLQENHPMIIIPVDIYVDKSVSNRVVGYVVSSNTRNVESLFSLGLLTFLLVVGIISYFYWMKKYKLF